MKKNLGDSCVYAMIAILADWYFYAANWLGFIRISEVLTNMTRYLANGVQRKDLILADKNKVCKTCGKQILKGSKRSKSCSKECGKIRQRSLENDKL